MGNIMVLTKDTAEVATREEDGSGPIVSLDAWLCEEPEISNNFEAERSQKVIIL